MSRRRSLGMGFGFMIAAVGYLALYHYPRSNSLDKEASATAHGVIPSHEGTSSSPSVPSAGVLGKDKAIAEPGLVPTRKVEDIELGREFLRVFEVMKDKNDAWDKHARYEQLLEPLLEEAYLNSLAEIFTLKTAESETERELQAIARVMGLKVFEMAVDKGLSAKAEDVITQLAASVARQDQVKKQYLDLESTIRTYFRKHPDFFKSQELFRQKLADVGINLDDIKKQGMQTDFGKGVIVGVLTSASAHGKFAEVEKWLTR